MAEFQLCLWLGSQTPNFLSVFRPWKTRVCGEDSFLKERPAQVTSSASWPAQLHLASLSSLSSSFSFSTWQRYPQGPSNSLPCLYACLGQKWRAENLREEFWSAVGLQVISKEFPLLLIILQERKALSISKMREIIHRLGGDCLRTCRIQCLRFFLWKGPSTAHSKENAWD